MGELDVVERIQRVDIEEQMKTAYIDYAMSVIVSRALPDVRDGLKPVHRRVLYGMSGLGLSHTQATKKSARIVGDVLGKYHPHGDSSVYDAMVRMVQPWSLRYPLVSGQGNFGSIDGDSPAAMRYTEARLARIAEDVLKDLDKETVDFTPNFDETLQEPTVLPTRVPQLLINGSSGIAVGMATSIAPHNLGEIVDATCAYIDNCEISIDEMMRYVKGPDFPTGAVVYGIEGVKEAFRTGRGRIVVRAKAKIEESDSGRASIIVTEIPYQVNKAEMIKRIAEMVNSKKIEGISYIGDESSRKGMRIVIKLKRDAAPSVVLNHLYKHSQLQSTFSVNNIALVDGRPRLLNLKEMIAHFVSHRHDVVVRRARYELRKAEERIHILQGLLVALDHIDEVVAIIRSSKSTAEAMARLMQRFNLSQLQVQAIVDMRLRVLTGLESDKVRAEHDELARKIQELTELLGSETLQFALIKEELLEVKEKYGDARRTEIIPTSKEFNEEDFFADDDVVITISHVGYIKRTNLAEYRAQRRGGKGALGSATRDQDFIEHLYTTTMHNTLLFFTEQGRCYWLKVYEIPDGQRNTKGRTLQNLIQIDPSDKVRAILNVRNLRDKEYTDSHYVVMCTRAGYVKKTLLTAYSNPRSMGIIAYDVREGDQLLSVELTDGRSDLILATKNGMAVRFPEDQVRSMGRKSMGVIGTRMAEGDELVGMVSYEPGDERKLLVVSELGFCKRSEVEEYRLIARGGKGVKNLNVKSAGKVVDVCLVKEQDDLMIITQKGLVIRFPVEQTPVTSRNTKGVQSIRLHDDDTIASISTVSNGEDEEDLDDVADMVEENMESSDGKSQSEEE